MTQAETAAHEARLAALSDDELLAEHRGLDWNDETLELVLGEMERRGLDL